MDILKEFTQNIEDHGLVTENDRILVAVSGGIDSVVMLHLFSMIQNKFNLDIIIIHLNHGIRGIESDRDEEFVKDLAGQYNYRMISDRIDVTGYANQNKLSVEHAARLVRYKYFTDRSISENASAVAVGHNLNDQVETFLDHLTRGSGIKGLGGMHFKRGIIIRPMLTIRRADIELYAHRSGLNYMIDSTNRNDNYKRNRIRNELIPYLEQKYNPNILSLLNNSSLIFKDVDLFLENEAKKALELCLKYNKKNKIILDINRFFKYFKIIQVYVLYYVLTEKLGLAYNLTFEQIDILLNLITRRKIGTRYKLDGGWEILIDRDGVIFHVVTASDYCIDVNIGETYQLFDGEKLFFSTILDKSNFPLSFPTSKNIEHIDYDLIEFPLKIRGYRSGDRFVPLNFKGQKRVSDFFTDNKIPLHLRDDYPLLTCRKGIIWIMGMRLDDRFKITAGTSKILKLELKEKHNIG